MPRGWGRVTPVDSAQNLNRHRFWVVCGRKITQEGEKNTEALLKMSKGLGRKGSAGLALCCQGCRLQAAGPREEGGADKVPSGLIRRHWHHPTQDT